MIGGWAPCPLLPLATPLSSPLQPITFVVRPSMPWRRTAIINRPSTLTDAVISHQTSNYSQQLVYRPISAVHEIGRVLGLMPVHWVQPGLLGKLGSLHPKITTAAFRGVHPPQRQETFFLVASTPSPFRPSTLSTYSSPLPVLHSPKFSCEV